MSAVGCPMKAFTLLCLAVLVTGASPLSASVVRVDQSGGGDFTTISEGVAAAQVGDTVLVWPGVYTGPANRGLEFRGVEMVVRAKGAPGDVVIDCEDQDRAFYVHAWEDTSLVIDGFTIMRGLAEDGGAIYVHRASVRLLNLTFRQNRAFFLGGAVCLDYSNAVVRHAAFIENWAGFRGGSIAITHSSPVVTDAGFKGNVARVGGGALHVECASPVLKDCRFYSNYAAAGIGGACADILGSAQFVRCLFHRNTASDFGGAFFMEGSSPFFVECRFYENESAEGGALKLIKCTPRFDACEFVGNAASGEGGAVHAELPGTVELYGCFLGRNTGSVGGALRIEKASLTLGCCTFVDNVASLAGGAVSCWSTTVAAVEGCTFSTNDGGYLGGALYATGDAQVWITGSTLAENAAEQGGGLACGGRAGAILTETIVAFSSEGDAVHCEEGGSATLLCSDLFGNAGGDWVGRIAAQYGADGNECEDPLFCRDDHPDEPYTLRDDSCCASENNPSCGLIGAWGVACAGTAVRPTSWGAIKARFR